MHNKHAWVNFGHNAVLDPEWDDVPVDDLRADVQRFGSITEAADNAVWQSALHARSWRP